MFDLTLQPLHSGSQRLLQLSEWIVVRRPAGNHNIVVVGAGALRLETAQGFLETTPDTVAHDGAADLLGDREAEPRF